jgi:hypothetical protein
MQNLQVPDEKALWVAAWVTARVLEQGNTIATVLWLSAQLKNLDRGALVSDANSVPPTRWNLLVNGLRLVLQAVRKR